MRINKILTLASIVTTVALTSVSSEQIVKKDPVETTYTVQAGDTLWSIASKYIKLNTYGPRRMDEFQSGIKELNPWLNTPERQYGGLIVPGEELRVNYWTKD